jgi:hypothetical protein
MSLAHPEGAELEAYAMGVAEDLPVDQIETHLRVCPACTEEVRRQAQLELALRELAARTPVCPGCQGVLEASRCPRCGAIARVRGFEVCEVLVTNAHGRLYRARDGEGRAIALKELAFVQPPHPDALAAFEREARLLRQLSHPQIPRFVDAFSEGEGVHTRLYLAQEFVEGESLLLRLQRHQFAEEVVREIARQVLDVLVYLQRLSPMVFHRDIKPGNLILRPDGRVALVDFGAARDMGSTVGATLVGTFGYMPIEQLGGIVDATTDLYALGATLAHLLGTARAVEVDRGPARARAVERVGGVPALPGQAAGPAARGSVSVGGGGGAGAAAGGAAGVAAVVVVVAAADGGGGGGGDRRGGDRGVGGRGVYRPPAEA